MVPLGIAFGLMVIQAGLPWWLAPALSLAAFAGSAELLLVGMIAVSAPLAGIALTTFLVNFRHVFYAVSFPLHLMKNRWVRAYSVYALTDEAYALTAASPGKWTQARLLSLQASFNLYWVGGGVIGVIIGAMLPGPIKGLDFALTALFITLVLDAARSRREVPSVLLAALAFAAAVLLVPSQALFVGLILFLGLLAVRYGVGKLRANRA